MSTPKRILSPITAQIANENKKPKLNDSTDKTEVKQLKTENQENYDFMFEDDDDDFEAAALNAIKEAEHMNALKLDLSVWKRCLVTQVEKEQKTHDLVLNVRSAKCEHGSKVCEHNSEVAKCHLQAPWNQTRIAVNDIVSLQGVWNDERRAFIIGKDNGYCVSHPDMLISGTTVVGSLFCRRKAVLQDRFRGIDANNKVMVVGSLVHEMLQIVLAKRLKTHAEIEAVACDLMESTQTAQTLFASQLNGQETTEEVKNFVPNIVDFVSEYLEDVEVVDSGMVPSNGFEGRIDEIKDIEENLWVPQLGLKGKVDVSVNIRRNRDRNALEFEQQQQHAIPLELKTGRATFSLEHKGQLLLYQMMLSATGHKIDTGLLLYLRDGIMREVRGSRNEQRDLIVLRNDLAHYLTRPPRLASIEELSNTTYQQQPFELPEPISHHSACAKCPYATICCSFASTDADLQLSRAHPLRQVMVKACGHLQPLEYEYFMRWCSLLALEEQESRKSNYLRTLWTETPEQRQNQARAVCNLLLLYDSEHLTTVVPEDSRFLHTFHGSEMAYTDLTLSGFDLGEYVIISSGKRLAIAAGCIHDLTARTVTVSLERDLRQNYANESFIMDKHESQNFNVFNFTNLGLLLDNNERAGELRKIVIARQPPTYSKILPKKISKEGTAIMRELNPVQRKAVLKALTTESYMLIKGLPGTGKTQTLVAIVRLLQLMRKTVCITSHTHSAVDNLMVRLLPHKLPIMRLGSNARVHPLLHSCSETELLKHCRSEAQVAKRYAAYPIVGVTCLGTSHALFLHRKFDYCIVDEATQVQQATVLRPLFSAEKFILVGDPDQLPPVIRSREARARGADETLFKRLDCDIATSVLTLQYRMNRSITKLANALTYNGALKCGNADVELATLNVSTSATARWLQRTLQTHIEQSVVLLDTLDCAERSNQFAIKRHINTCSAIEKNFSGEAEDGADADATPNKQPLRKRVSKYTNYCEAGVLIQIIRVLLERRYDPAHIGIIAPYRAQVELLRKLLTLHQEYFVTLHFERVEVNTVDQYQGRDKDIIIYSCTKTGSAITGSDFERSSETEILDDHRRLTVAITRAKLKLIIIGDTACLEQYEPFRQLFEHIPAVSKLKLLDDRLEFGWHMLLDALSAVIYS